MPAANLLNNDGTASSATAILLSHRGFRRDAARFTQALAAFQEGDTVRADQLREAWAFLEPLLHAHHHAEDERIFPSLLDKPGFPAPVVDGLLDVHQRLARRIQEMTRSLARLPADAGMRMTRNAIKGFNEVLLPHLQAEDDLMVPLLRAAPTTEAEAALIPKTEYAVLIPGIAWCSEGVDPAIVDATFRAFPRDILDHVPAAKADYAARCERWWGGLLAPTGTTAEPT